MKCLFKIWLVFSCILPLGGMSQSSFSDREYWATLCYEIAAPVLSNISKGELKANMRVEVSPEWDNRNKDVAYMETFGRLMAGIAPWLNLPDDTTPEGKQRKQLREWALAGYKNAVNPESPDYLLWKGHHQALVDAAYIANSFVRAPQSLWEPLDDTTKERFIYEFKELRKIKPVYNNWILFRAMIEAFLLTIDEDADGYALDITLRKMDEWYLGDGWYADGKDFSLDYYNGYVLHSMIVEITEILENRNLPTPISFNLALRRMQRHNQHLERLISPEGTFPAVGRSMTYRMGAFQPLALSAWKYGLPSTLSNGQVRAALTLVMKNMFETNDNFTSEGFLQLGFTGYQPELADYYTNTGSLYITSLVFLPLGLPADHPFWTEPAEEWTAKKAWNRKSFPKDYHESIRK